MFPPLAATGAVRDDTPRMEMVFRGLCARAAGQRLVVYSGEPRDSDLLLHRRESLVIPGLKYISARYLDTGIERHYDAEDGTQICFWTRYDNCGRLGKSTRYERQKGEKRWKKVKP